MSTYSTYSHSEKNKDRVGKWRKKDDLKIGRKRSGVKKKKKKAEEEQTGYDLDGDDTLTAVRNTSSLILSEEVEQGSEMDTEGPFISVLLSYYNIKKNK